MDDHLFQFVMYFTNSFLVIDESPYHTVTMPVRTDEYDSDSDSPSGKGFVISF